MYIPPSTRVTDRTVLHELMERFSFGTLVTARDGCPNATHLPFLVSPGGEHGRLVAHLARANEQWRDFSSGREVLAIFQGDHTYISPAWYEDHPSVPTWNYMAVHAYGVPRVLDDAVLVRQYLESLVALHEAPFDDPWRMDLPAEYLSGMVRGIVAFEIPISRLEGKFKLSQNRSVRDQRRVVDALSRSSDSRAQGVRAKMEAGLRVVAEEGDSNSDRQTGDSRQKPDRGAADEQGSRHLPSS